MNKYLSKYEITIHNYWTDTILHTHDIRVAANHMIYKSRQPPSSSHENIIFTIDDIKYAVEPRPFHDHLASNSLFDDIHKKIIDDIIYCLDLHEALYNDQ